MDPSQQGFSASRGGGFPVELTIRGRDWDALGRVLARRSWRRCAQTGLVTDVDSDYQVGMPEVQVIPDRNKAADLGVSMADIGETINAAIGGERVGKFKDKRPPLRHPRAPARPSSASGRRTSSGCSCAPAAGGLVRLGDLVRIEQQPTLQAITRKDRERAITHLRQRGPRRLAGGRARAVRRSIAREVAARRLPRHPLGHAARPSRSRSTR